MASIPIDFDKLAALTPLRSTKPSSNGTSVDSTPFRDHIQGPATVKPSTPSPSESDSSRPAEATRTASAKPVSKTGGSQKTTEDEPASDEILSEETASANTVTAPEEEKEEAEQPSDDAVTSVFPTAIATSPLPSEEKKVPTESQDSKIILGEGDEADGEIQEQGKSKTLPSAVAKKDAVPAHFQALNGLAEAEQPCVGESEIEIENPSQLDVPTADVASANAANAPATMVIGPDCELMPSPPQSVAPITTENVAGETAPQEAVALPVSTKLAGTDEKAASKKGGG